MVVIVPSSSNSSSSRSSPPPPSTKGATGGVDVGSSSTRASLNSSSFARMCSFLSLLLFVYFFPFFKEMKSRVIFPLSV